MKIEKETQSIKLNSGKTVNAIKGDRSPNAALTRTELAVLHLMPAGDPVAFTYIGDGKVKFFFSPDNVSTTPPELWYPDAESEGVRPITLDDGSVIPFMGSESAESLGFHTKEDLDAMHLMIVESPVAYTHKETEEGTAVGETVFLYDTRTCIRQALKCIRCGKEDRFRNKLCRKCYEKDMLKRRKVGDEYRASVTGIDRGKAIFFDLELTGVYPYDEIISVSITDGYGNEIMDTLVRPERRRQWNITVKIHGITPKMTKYAPYLSEITPKIKEILLNSEIIVAYGISTDYSHIKKIFTEEEQSILLPKLRDCAKEYVRYISEYEPDINKSSLVSATEYFGIEWSGTAHTSMADTHACRILWEKIFPSCYKEEMSPSGETEIMKRINALPSVKYITFDEAFEKAKNDASDDNRQKHADKPKSKQKPAHPAAENNAKRQAAKSSLENKTSKTPPEEKKPEKQGMLLGFFKRFVKGDKEPGAKK